MEYEKNINLPIAIDRFEEEIEGLTAYKEMCDKITDPELKGIFEQIIVDEKAHATSLLTWINSAVKSVLG